MWPNNYKHVPFPPVEHLHLYLVLVPGINRLHKKQINFFSSLIAFHWLHSPIVLENLALVLFLLFSKVKTKPYVVAHIHNLSAWKVGIIAKNEVSPARTT